MSSSSAFTLQIEEQIREGAVHLVLRGDLDIATAPMLESATAAARASHVAVCVDLSELRFIDSCGLRAVLSSHHHARRAGTPLAVILGDGQAARLFALVGVSDVLDVQDGVGQPAPS